MTTWPLGGKKKLYHVKFKSKTGYLGEKIASYLGKSAVEVDVKNVTQYTAVHSSTHTVGQAHLFGLDVPVEQYGSTHVI